MNNYDSKYSELINQNIKEWLLEAESSATNTKNIDIFKAVNKLIIDYFTKIVIEYNKDKLSEFNSLIIHFCIDFYWDKNNPKFPQAVEFVNGWKVLAIIADRLKSFHKFSDIVAKIKSSERNIKIIQYLKNKPVMKSKELADEVGIEHNSLCNQTAELLKYGIIGRDKAGKNSYYYLTPNGKKYYEELFSNNQIDFMEFIKNKYREFIYSASQKEREEFIDVLKIQEFFNISEIDIPDIKSDDPKITGRFWKFENLV